MWSLKRCVVSRTRTVKRTFSKEVKQWLMDQGIEEHISNGIINAFPNGRLSIQEVKALGKSGLNSLSNAVRRELGNPSSQPRQAQEISIKIEVPHQRVSLELPVRVGTTFYQLAKQNEDIGQYLVCACSGVAACSTCHVIVEKEYYDKLPLPQEDELDMLDLAWGVTETSRLGCQIKFKENINGLKVTIPSQANNLFS